jgi:hypothetical protein
MSIANINKIKQLLPADLLERGVSLDYMGIDEFAWNWQDILIVIDYFLNNHVFLSGGDVYSAVNGTLRPTGDNWYINKSSYLSTSNDLEKSRNVSIDFINKYVEKNGENFLFSVVVDN